MKTITLLLSIPLLSLTSCEKQKYQQTGAPRYDVHTFSVMGMAYICQITDNEEKKTYMYDVKDKSMKLKAVIDLTRVGEKEITFDKISEDK